MSKMIKVLQNESEQYIKDTKLLMEALLFYANPDNWEPKAQGEYFPIQTDGGDKAREALKKFLYE